MTDQHRRAGDAGCLKQRVEIGGGVPSLPRRRGGVARTGHGVGAVVAADAGESGNSALHAELRSGAIAQTGFQHDGGAAGSPAREIELAASDVE